VGGWRVVNRTRGLVLADRARLADRPWSRAVGLLGRSGLAPGEGLVLLPCAGVHTLGMRFALDVAYLEVARGAAGGRVLWAARLEPWRVGPWRPGVGAVVELPAGTLGATRKGDEITWEPADA
jgi:uncharacterized membrane protein (UPF0127 family)